jgi:hypothetical protein
VQVVVVVAKSAANDPTGQTVNPNCGQWRASAVEGKGWIVTSYSPYSQLFTMEGVRGKIRELQEWANFAPMPRHPPPSVGGYKSHLFLFGG